MLGEKGGGESSVSLNGTNSFIFYHTMAVITTVLALKPKGGFIVSHCSQTFHPTQICKTILEVEKSLGGDFAMHFLWRQK